ncbi:MAG TPA: TIM barrel protein, partial [Methanomicrobiales archaeon]|nr:TIM barrel protein [Methanomicrobiales archaeon]
MVLIPAFSASSRVWESCEWVYSLETIGYEGWEIVAEGKYRFDNQENLKNFKEILASTNLKVTVHAPYSDLNIASMNYPIYRESIRQVNATIAYASSLSAEKVTFHPGYLSPLGKLVPDRVWGAQRSALAEIGKVAVEHGVLAC